MKTLKRSCVLAVALSALLCADASYAGYKFGGFRSRPSYSRPTYKAPQKQTAQKPKQQQATTAKQKQEAQKTVDRMVAARRTATYANNGTNWLPWLAVGYMLGSSGGHAQTFAVPAEVKDAGKNPEAKPCDVMPPLRCDWIAGT